MDVERKARDLLREMHRLGRTTTGLELMELTGQSGATYPALVRLENDGFITKRRPDPGPDGQVRPLEFTLTEAGVRRARLLPEEPEKRSWLRRGRK